MHHETIYAKAVMDGVPNKEGVKKVEIDLGELVGVTAHDLGHVVKDVCGWKVEINEIDSVVKCKCGYHGKAKIKERMHDLVVFCCPECGEIPEVVEGDKMKIKKVIYEN